MVKLGIIVNPNAGKIRKKKFNISKLEKIVGKEYIKYIGEEENYRIFEYFKEKGTNIIAIAGGDGTYHRIITDLLNLYNDDLPSITFLKAGTQNMAARVLGFKDAYKTLNKLLEEDIDYARIKPLKIIAEDHIFYGFTFSALGIAKFMELYSDETIAVLGIKKTSIVKASCLLLKCIFSAIFGGNLYENIARPSRIDIYMKNETNKNLSGIYNMFVITSLPIRILAFKVFKDVEDIAMAGGFINARHIFNNLIIPRILLGKELKDVIICKGKEAIIKPYSRFKYAIDGDLYMQHTTQDIIIEQGPILKIAK